MKFLLVLTWFFIVVVTNQLYQNNKFQEEHQIIMDCKFTFEESTDGLEIPSSIIKQLVLVDVEYYSFDEKLHKGQIVINKKASKDIKEIFEFIKEARFPIAKVVPIVKYKWNDELSMNDNNTASFNYRKVEGSKILSAHSYGMAIDINPIHNPQIKGTVVKPQTASYDPKVKGTILRDSKLVNEFVKRGWQWGGRWRSTKDYQHFEKKN